MKGLMKRIHFCLILLSILTLMVGCMSIPATVPVEAPTQSVTTIDLKTVSANVTAYPLETPIPFETVSPATTSDYDPSVEPIILLVEKDLYQKTGIDMEKMIVLAVEAVEWPDGSLGCGKPGMKYLQVVTPGFQISLEASGQVYSYHTNATNQIILCSQRSPISISSTP